MVQVTSKNAAGRSLVVHDFAKLLAKGKGEDKAEVGLQLLYGNLVRQNPAAFKELVTSNKKVLQKLLWLGPEESSAFLHSNALTYRSMEHLKRTLLDLLGIKTLSMHKDGTTRNLRHPIYGGRLMAIIESDPGGHSMKHAVRFGPNNLVVLGAYKASDIHANCVTFLAPWIPQLQALMVEVWLVWREAREEDMPELEEGRVYEELGLDIIQDATDLNLPLDNLQMVVVGGRQ